MATNASYESLGYQDEIQSVAKYITLQQQEWVYVDGVLNLSNCTEINASRKKRKENNGNKVMTDAYTVVLTLTNVISTTAGNMTGVDMLLEPNSNTNKSLLPNEIAETSPSKCNKQHIAQYPDPWCPHPPRAARK